MPRCGICASKCEWVDKPGSVVGTAIYLERMSPRVSSTQPECTEGRPYGTPICACSRWGFPSHVVANALVRFYRTVSAFPSRRGSLLFCGTNPSGRPAQPLAGILPFGARTFLTPLKAARDRLARSQCGILPYRNRNKEHHDNLRIGWRHIFQRTRFHGAL